MPMSAVRGLLVAFALMPVAAYATGGSPQAHCLEKVARVEGNVRAELARLTPAGLWPATVTLTYPVPLAAGIYVPTGEYLETASTRSTSFSVPPQRLILTRELTLLELRRADCMRLPVQKQGDPAVSVARSSGIRRLVPR
jgi:hypothetical protein